MEILKYSNGQYAGTREQEVSFRPGMNVVLGNNETGKSTMIAGIYDTLFMHSKLDGRKDKEFTASRFPTGGGNSIDGEVKLILNGQKATVRKEWDKTNSDPRTVLVLEPGGKFSGKGAETKLSELLVHGLGIYDNIVFGRQNNEAAILDWYFDFVSGNLGKGSGEDVSSARKKIAEAFSAASGISEEAFERRLEEKLAELSSHWDFSMQRPEGGRGLLNPWSRGVGQILQAYYALEERRQAAEEAQRAFVEFDAMKTRLEALRQERRELEQNLRQLQAMESSAALIGSQHSLEKDLERLEQALREWPELTKELANLTGLKQEGDEREKRFRKQELGRSIEKIKDLLGRREELLQLAVPLGNIEKEAEACRRALFKAEQCEKLLSSGKLHASIAMQPGYTALLTTAVGETVEVAASLEQDVDGFAKIEIPGVGRIAIAPQDLDIPELEEQIRAGRNFVKEILEKYSAAGMEELEEKEAEYRETTKTIDRLDAELMRIPGYDGLEKLEQEMDGVTVHENVCVREDWEDIVRRALEKCREGSLSERIAVIESALRGYEKDYNSISRLAELAQAQRAKLGEISAQLELLPPFTLTVEEFGRQKRETAARLNGPDGNGGVAGDIEKLIGDLRVKEAALDNISAEEIEAEVKALEQEFEHSIRLHSQYSKIKEDFLRLKAEQSDQFAAFYDQFNEYLGIVTGGQVQLEEGSTLKSGSNSLTAKELLSRGTRQTVLLAFRLALLKFYYRDEPGTIVLDDILLDMDPGRRENSVRLLKEFAEGNQVIFTTCDPGIAEMLGGNLVELE